MRMDSHTPPRIPIEWDNDDIQLKKKKYWTTYWYGALTAVVTMYLIGMGMDDPGFFFFKACRFVYELLTPVEWFR